MTLNVSAYVFCTARLEFNRTDLKDPLMTKYWAAVIVAEPIADEKLAKFGGFDFSDRSDENGEKLLSRLEYFLRQHRAKDALSDEWMLYGLVLMPTLDPYASAVPRPW